MGFLGVAWAMACVVIALAVVALGVGAVILIIRKSGSFAIPRTRADVGLKDIGRGAASAYVGKQYLMSRAEAAFYQVLMQAVGNEFLVMAKVRLGDVVEARGGEWLQRRQAGNRIWQKHVDFVLLDARDLRIRMTVELDDKSHEREDRRERDGFVDGVLQQAGVPLVRFKAAAGYQVEEVRQMLRNGNGTTGPWTGV